MFACRRGLGLILACLFVAGCGGEPSAKSSLDTMSEQERSEVMQKTVQQTMQINQQAMEQQGMTPPAGANMPVGFQPPESMKQYMNRQGGGGGVAPGGAGAPAAQPQAK